MDLNTPNENQTLKKNRTHNETTSKTLNETSNETPNETLHELASSDAFVLNPKCVLVDSASKKII